MLFCFADRDRIYEYQVLGVQKLLLPLINFAHSLRQNLHIAVSYKSGRQETHLAESHKTTLEGVIFRSLLPLFHVQATEKWKKCSRQQCCHDEIN